MSHWWRAHDEAVDDPKLGLLSDRLHRCWFNLNCLASAHGGTLPPTGVVAFKLRVSEHKAAEIITALVQARLIDRKEDGSFAPHNWDVRQFKSDVTDPTNATRQKRYRDRHAVTANTVTETVTVTPPRDREQNTDSETEQIQKEARKRASRIPENWMPSDEGGKFALSHGLSQAEANTELQKFTNYWTAKGGQGATKLDWEATWRNWILTTVERKGPQNGRGKQSLSELAFDLADRAREREREAGIGRPLAPVRSS